MTDAKAQPEQLVEEARCPDCGIPVRWCKAVTSNPARCWRWDYEQFDETATALSECREALRNLEERIDRGHGTSYGDGYMDGLRQGKVAAQPPSEGLRR